MTMPTWAVCWVCDVTFSDHDEGESQPYGCWLFVAKSCLDCDQPPTAHDPGTKRCLFSPMTTYVTINDD